MRAGRGGSSVTQELSSYLKYGLQFRSQRSGNQASSNAAVAADDVRGGSWETYDLNLFVVFGRD